MTPVFRKDGHYRKRLRQIAVAVREALEEYGGSAADPLFKDFPAGCCGGASELLGRCLLESGFDNVVYKAGWRDGRSHAWVEAGGVTVDITADQFGKPRVIVAMDSKWHKSWDVDQQRAPICSADQWPAYPGAAWAAIQARVWLL
jgi:hypothetical protein